MSPSLCDVRWKIEQFHREAKQLTGHANVVSRVLFAITLPLRVWIHLMRKASEKGQTSQTWIDF